MIHDWRNMPTEEQLQNIVGVVGTAETILVMLPSDPSFDQVATATSLYLSLEKMGKKVSLLSPEEKLTNFEDLNASDMVASQLGGKNLQVSFDYHPDAIDKVSYHINEERGKFYLVIQPQKGSPPLDPKTVEYDFAGAEADLIFLVGVSSLEDLEHLYFGYENLYQDGATISINNFETKVANINLDFSNASCLSEGVCDLVKTLGVELDGDIATNILAGIEEKTNGFHSLTTSAKTFEITAELMRAGARRVRRKSNQAKEKNVMNKKIEGSINSSSFTKVSADLEIKNKKVKTEKQIKKEKINSPKVGGLDHQPSEGKIGV